ncbi:MAG: hypothetical protein C5B57_09415 [Blastocatellia bacterium]|nr:MAG: hypothetical protein C5B57_09415 [Blastocatellia bacterium]
MKKRTAASAGLLTLVIASVSATAMLAGSQARPAFTQAANRYVPPRTPWGDPDLQGNLTNLYEVGTPFERPEEFAGRKVDEIKGEELATLRRSIQERTRTEELAGEIGGTRWIWLDSFQHEKGGRAWFVVDPPDGKIPPLTAQGESRAARRAAARQSSGRGPADSYEDRSLYDRCITRGLPNSMMPAVYGNSYQIVQGPGWVAIRYEMIHETRVIPLDGRSHVGKNLRLDMGDARGHWDGDTLVVETTNFRERSAYRQANPEALKLVERFTRVAPDKIAWAVSVDDPTTWVRPWTFMVPLTINDREPLMPYECHEGNYAMTNILSGARAEEKAVAEER